MSKKSWSYGSVAAVAGALLTFSALAAPTMTDTFAFVERRAATSFWSAGQTFLLGSTSVQAGGSGLTVTFLLPMPRCLTFRRAC